MACKREARPGNELCRVLFVSQKDLKIDRCSSLEMTSQSVIRQTNKVHGEKRRPHDGPVPPLVRFVTRRLAVGTVLSCDKLVTLALVLPRSTRKANLGKQYQSYQITVGSSLEPRFPDHESLTA